MKSIVEQQFRAFGNIFRYLNHKQELLDFVDELSGKSAAARQHVINLIEKYQMVTKAHPSTIRIVFYLLGYRRLSKEIR